MSSLACTPVHMFHDTQCFMRKTQSVSYTSNDAVIGHPRSGMVYKFGPVCMSVSLSLCMSVCLSNDNFRNLDVGSSYLHMRHISTDYGSSSYMKVIGWRSSESKTSNSHNVHVKLRPPITSVLSNIEPWCLRAAWGFLVRRIEWYDRYLCHVTGSYHA